MRRKLNLDACRYLPNNRAEAQAIGPNSLGIEALAEALAMGANDAARINMARVIAESVAGRKYSSTARAIAADISAGRRPLPPIPAYLLA